MRFAKKRGSVQERSGDSRESANRFARIGPSKTQQLEPFVRNCGWNRNRIFLVKLWRVPNPPGANALVAERAPWRSSQSCVTGGQQPIGNPYRFLSHFFCTPGNPCATPIVTRGKALSATRGLAPGGLGTRQKLYRNAKQAFPP